MNIVLTIAGSDSGGGAGIQADLKTFESHGVFGASVITAITAQSTKKILSIQELKPEMVLSQLKAVFDDLNVSTVKTGMLCNAEIVRAVAKFLKRKNILLVIDPVIISSSGKNLLHKNAIPVLVKELIPLCTLITPNISEAKTLAGISIRNEKDILMASKKISALNPKMYVLIKGGHLPTRNLARDFLFYRDAFTHFDAPFVEGKKFHGTGCKFSAAITANLAKGENVVSSVQKAKEYITNILQKDSLIRQFDN